MSSPGEHALDGTGHPHLRALGENTKLNIRKFETGATRDTDSGKLKHAGFLCPFVLTRFSEYMHKHRLQSDGTLRDPDNWKRGIPLDAYEDSLIRHVMDFWRAYLGEPVKPAKANDPQDMEELLCAIMFNTMGYLHVLLKEKRANKS